MRNDVFMILPPKCHLDGKNSADLTTSNAGFHKKRIFEVSINTRRVRTIETFAVYFGMIILNLSLWVESLRYVDG